MKRWIWLFLMGMILTGCGAAADRSSEGAGVAGPALILFYTDN